MVTQAGLETSRRSSDLGFRGVAEVTRESEEARTKKVVWNNMFSFRFQSDWFDQGKAFEVCL